MRKSACMRVYENYTQNKKDRIPTTYFNKYMKKTLPLKLCDFYVSSSYKSYLPCGGSYDINSYDAIKQNILAGARLLNLDIYGDPKNDFKPIIRNKTNMPVYGKYLDVDKCFKIIKRFAWLDNKTYPLILYLTFDDDETQINRLTYYHLNQLLIDNFADKFMDKKYGFSGRNSLFPLGQIEMKECLGKIIIISNKYPLMGKLNELINATSNEEEQLVRMRKYTEVDKSYGGIISKDMDIDSMINFGRENITLIKPEQLETLTNLWNPKIDLYNIPGEDCWQFGIQWVMMNYQLYDENMKKYIEKFKNGGFVLKPEKLRFIPKPPPVLEKQNPKVSYKPEKYKLQGWKENIKF